MKVNNNIVQGSDEWLAARCGIPTASNFDKIATSKGLQSKQREKYLYRVAGERVTGAPEETYQNKAMANGIEREPEARDTYRLITGSEVTEVGFCTTDDGLAGCSPDSLVDDDGLLEIKCPKIETHVSYLLSGKLPTEYTQQVQGQMLVTGREWCDFMSYYPGLKPLIIRVERDEVFLTALKFGLKLLCKELEIIAEKIRS